MENQQILPRLLDIKQSADYLSISADMVRKLTREGHLEVTEIGRRRLYDRRRLDMYIEKNTVKMV